MTNDFEMVDGIKCFSLKEAYFNDGFDCSHFKKLYNLEENSFWFRCRNRIIRILVNRFVNKKTDAKFLEIGCGTGFVLKGLLELGLRNITLVGSDVYLEGLKYARARLNASVELIQLDALNIPFENEYDYIGAFDVLEHVVDDEQVLENIHRCLKENGLLFISVPQYRFLWSYFDEISQHKRRYSKQEIQDKLINHNFSVCYHSSFISTLFPLMVASRKIKGNKKISSSGINYDELRVNKVLDKLFEYILRIDEVLIRLNFRLPVGGSLIVVARKN